MLMPTKVKISFSASRFKDETMGLVITANNQEVFNQPLDLKDTFNIEFNADLPAQIKIVTSGKGPVDTKVDNTGNIISDKFIKITGVIIGGIIIPQWIIEKNFIQFNTEHGTISTNYLGFNGQAILALPEDLFSMFLDFYTVG